MSSVGTTPVIRTGVAGSNPGGTNTEGLKITEKCCLCSEICKWLDFLVFSDKDEKPYVPSHSTFNDLFLWDVKEPTSLFEKTVGVEDPGCVVSLYGLRDWVGMAPRMGPKYRSCTFPLGRPVSRKAG